MAKKDDNKLQDRLDRLENAFGPIDYKKTSEYNNDINNKSPKRGMPTFKTSEVVILLIITTIVSLIMGSAATYNLAPTKGEKVDSELQNFINNYDYIIDNYNGEVNKEELLDAALEGMLGKLDKNSTYLESDTSKNFNILLEGSYDGLGIQVYNDKEGNIIIYSVFKNSPAAKAGLKAGDIITKVNGESLKGLTSSDLVDKVQKSKNKNITITYKRDQSENTVKLNIDSINLDSVSAKTFEEDGKKVGYIALGIFASNSYSQFKKELNKLEKENINSLIIDLRGNSGGYLSSAENILSLFLDSSHVLYQIKKDDVVTKHYSKGSKDKKYKIVILVDQNSASASEVTASALKEEYGATIVGKKTYGKGSVQEMQNLPNGDKYKLTTKNWLTPKGELIEGKGITPDVEIDFDTKYFDNPADVNDSQLQKALEEAKK